MNYYQRRALEQEVELYAKHQEIEELLTSYRVWLNSEYLLEARELAEKYEMENYHYSRLELHNLHEASEQANQ